MQQSPRSGAGRYLKSAKQRARADFSDAMIHRVVVRAAAWCTPERVLEARAEPGQSCEQHVTRQPDRSHSTGCNKLRSFWHTWMGDFQSSTGSDALCDEGSGYERLTGLHFPPEHAASSTRRQRREQRIERLQASCGVIS